MTTTLHFIGDQPGSRPLNELYDLARAAVLHGVTSCGFDGVSGVTTEEALEIAADFFTAVEARGGWTSLPADRVTVSDPVPADGMGRP